jgi:hypothetical protein
MSMSIDQIEQQLADLQVRVSGLESQASIDASSGEFPDPILEAKALAIVRDIFPGTPRVEVTFDPQEPERKWRVICVPVPENFDSERANEEWHRRIYEELGGENVWRYSLYMEFDDV